MGEQEWHDGNTSIEWQRQHQALLHVARRLRAAVVKIDALHSHCECWDISRTILDDPAVRALGEEPPDETPPPPPLDGFTPNLQP